MSGKISNVGASVRQRLKNKAQEQGLPFNEILQRYAIERFLLRLSESNYKNKFLLKGAQMLLAWRSERVRPTMDIDLLGYTDNSLENLESIIKELCRMNHYDADGILFDENSVAAIAIKEDAEYEGVRVLFTGELDSARMHMQIDIGFNDAVTPAPDIINFPSLLGQSEPELKGYNRETLIAEKYEAMVKLGEFNSRMKDFFDIWLLSRHFSFDAVELRTAIEATFERRGTSLKGLPDILLPDSNVAEEKQKQWIAFLKKSRLDYAPESFKEVTSSLADFLKAIVGDSEGEVLQHTAWKPCGPWSTATINS